ncbi:hypothetical protein CVT24_012180 [Panaeolus cyanescens]|uniref:Uncharacterized protein n=1 Tax=Panaeolus cyanescens TaxID=181874 RepID=A0A409YJ22_9AGAR|nr:hypothetical protein CVT24_012180 [Panaeolus cyanescens]
MSAPGKGDDIASTGDTPDNPIDVDMLDDEDWVTKPPDELEHAKPPHPMDSDDAEMLTVEELVSARMLSSGSSPARPSSPPPIPLPPSPKDDTYVPSSSPSPPTPPTPPLIRARRRGKKKAEDSGSQHEPSKSKPIRRRSPSSEQPRRVRPRPASPIPATSDASTARPNEGPSRQTTLTEIFTAALVNSRMWVDEIDEPTAEEQAQRRDAEDRRMTAMQRRAEQEDRASRARIAQAVAARQRAGRETQDRAATRIRRRRPSAPDDDPPPAYHTLFPDQ